MGISPVAPLEVEQHEESPAPQTPNWVVAITEAALADRALLVDGAGHDCDWIAQVQSKFQATSDDTRSGGMLGVRLLWTDFDLD